VKSRHGTTAPAVVHKERQLDDELTKYMTQHSTLSNSTMAFFSLVALNQEHLECCRAIQLARRCQLQIHGTSVDSVLVNGSREQMARLRIEAEQLCRVDGSRILQVKDARKSPSHAFSERAIAAKVSPWRAFAPCKGERRFGSKAFGQWFHDPHFAHTRNWETLTEPEGIGACDAADTFQAEAAVRIVVNGGGVVEGRGGTGKSELIRNLVTQFEAAGYKGKVDVLATTHVQAPVVEGDTIRRRHPAQVLAEFGSVSS